MFFLTWLSFVFADPKLQRREVYSQSLQKKMHISTIADNISHPEFGYAVVLMLHGLGDDDLGFRGNIGYFAQSSIPLVIILPEGERGYWTDGNLGNYTSWALEAFELERERLGLSLSPCRTIVAGVSMGGFGALHIGLANPQKFGHIVSMSPPDLEFAIKNMPSRGPMRDLYTNVWGDPIDMSKAMSINPYRRLEQGEGKDQHLMVVIGDREPEKFTRGVERITEVALRRKLDYHLRVVPNAGHMWNPTWGEFTTMWWIDGIANHISSTTNPKCPM
jgi:putative tributyrin esterase